MELSKQAIMDNSVPVTECGCWIWAGGLNRGGYGVATFPGFWGGHTQRAHRASYTVFNGAIPKGAHVLHRCDIRCCVNPDHLYIGTNDENHADKKRKNRARPQFKGIPGKVRGIYFEKPKRLWRARIRINNRLITLSRHKRKTSAIAAYNSALKVYLATLKG